MSALKPESSYRRHWWNSSTALLGKQLHWSVAGPFFRPLHLQLDEMIDSWRELADSVAERAVSIGFMPDGQASRVATDSAVTGVEPGAIEDHRVVGTLTHQLAATVERVRRRMNRVAELDSPSEDVLVEVARKLEEQLWMIRVQQGSRSE